MRVKRLDETDAAALVEISKAPGFPCELTEDDAKAFCRGRLPSKEGVQTYGIFDGKALLSVATATFCRVFPCADAPSGFIVHISGVYTLPEYRHRHYASELLSAAEADAKAFGAEYICCDSTQDGLYYSCGFQPAPDNETRMWKHVR